MARHSGITKLLVFTALASAAFAGSTAVAAAQSVAGSRAPDMRTLYASPLDIADGKQLAMMACARCHGPHGIGGKADVPHIAGQRPAYFYRALEDYKSGRRHNTAMRDAVKFLSTEAMIKVSAYYAGLDPAQPPPGPVPSPKPGPLAAGKAAAAACTGCHGTTGVSAIPGIPSLTGLHPKYLVAAMRAYQDGQRKNNTMKGMVAALNDKTMANIALFFALQKPARAKTKAVGNATAGKTASTSCSGCHGENGVSASAATPSLAGQDAHYLVAALNAYKDGKRANETMKGMAGALNETTMKNLAAYYAAQTPQAPKVRKPMTTMDWVARCNRCHGVNGNSTDPRFPMLASQRATYLEKALHDYRTHRRQSNAMVPMAAGLNEVDIVNLTTYYAHQKARAVLFVPLPSK